ncbi:hypothetical protein [Nonomuraea typhae]|uniref:EF-hand domain-containing protein n=1 Tax=Nonomuraea typhae TaxID=2603600 RepID=A0ABW7Z6S8_9ACTN
MLRRTILDAAEACFRAGDPTASGLLSLPAYQKIMAVIGVDAGQAAAAFARIDGDGDAFITNDELIAAVTDFYTSTEPDAPGNAFYGR